jgi:hypothetical protein
MKRLSSLLLISTVILFLASPMEIYGGQQDQVVLEKLDLHQSSDFLKTAISISGEFGYQHFELNNPSRLVVEISPLGEIRTEESYEINAFGVNAVRTGRYKPDTARIVFDLQENQPSYEIIQVDNGIEVVFRWPEDIDRVPPVAEKTEAIDRLPPQAEKVEEPKEIPQEEMKKENRLKSISYGKSGDQLKVDIRIDGNFLHRSVELKHFSQLILDVWPVPILAVQSLRNINLSGLREIIVQKTGTDTARIVLDFSGMLSSFKIERKEDGLSLTLLPVEKPVGVPVAPEEKPVYDPIENTAITFTAGGYEVSDYVYNQIYSGDTLMFGFELSKIFARNGNHNFGVVLGGNYYKDTGSSTLTQQEVTFTLIPYYFCIEYLWNQDVVIPFVRAGVNVMSYKEKSELHEVSGSSVGPQIALGIYIRVHGLEQLRFKFYFKWIGATAKEEDVELKIGGIEAGMGITFGFNLF